MNMHAEISVGQIGEIPVDRGKDVVEVEPLADRCVDAAALVVECAAVGHEDAQTPQVVAGDRGQGRKGVVVSRGRVKGTGIMT